MNGTQAQEGQQSAERKARSLPSEAVIRNFRRTEFDSPNVPVNGLSVSTEGAISADAQGKQP